MKPMEERTMVIRRDDPEGPSDHELWLIFLESVADAVVLPQVAENAVLVPGPEEPQ